MISRRRFLELSGAGGLWVGLYGCRDKSGKEAPQPAAPPPPAATEAGIPAAVESDGEVVALSAWIHIAENDVVTFFIPEAEMGHGVHTSVSADIAAELGADFSRVIAQSAPGAPQSVPPGQPS